MKKYEYEVYHDVFNRCHPKLRYKILFFWWSKWYYMESIGGTAIRLYPNAGKGYTEKEAFEIIEDWKLDLIRK